jgi:hypothetical protein
MKYVDFLNLHNAGRELCFSPCTNSKTTEKAIVRDINNPRMGFRVLKDKSTKITGKTMVYEDMFKDGEIFFRVK